MNTYKAQIFFEKKKIPKYRIIVADSIRVAIDLMIIHVNTSCCNKVYPSDFYDSEIIKESGNVVILHILKSGKVHLKVVIKKTKPGGEVLKGLLLSENQNQCLAWAGIKARRNKKSIK
jgi:hypothetical protein